MTDFIHFRMSYGKIATDKFTYCKPIRWFQENMFIQNVDPLAALMFYKRHLMIDDLLSTSPD